MAFLGGKNSYDRREYFKEYKGALRLLRKRKAPVDKEKQILSRADAEVLFFFGAREQQGSLARLRHRLHHRQPQYILWSRS